MDQLCWVQRVGSYLVGILVFGFIIHAQSREPDIQKRLDLIKSGKIGEVKSELTRLLEQYPNHVGVMFLSGVLTTDGKEAVKIFQSIVDRFPKSEWADDALYRVYQYYYSIGLYRTAERTLKQLKENYPRSKYVTATRIDLNDEVQGEGAAIHYAVQVGAYATPENAKKQKLLFEGLGYSVEIRNKVREGKTVHLVWVGDYATYADAQEVSETLKTQHGIDAVVVSW
jgi:tetratricopeptide (TPR) repeat protein